MDFFGVRLFLVKLARDLKHDLGPQNVAEVPGNPMISDIISIWPDAKGGCFFFGRKKRLCKKYPYHPWDWYIYLHVDDYYRKCRFIYHTWIL